MTQTIENSFHSTSADMGDSHIEIHKGQRTRLTKGEPLVETLSDNKLSDSSYDLMLAVAHKQGVKNEEEWREYNRSIRPVRRKKTYAEYLASLCSKVTNGLQSRLDNPKAPRSRRTQYAQQLASIDKNKGVPIDGSLFYLSNYRDYELHAKDYDRYRKFERETFKRFYASDAFKKLNPGIFRAEIHYDELGTMHLQTQAVWFKTDKSGRAQYSKRGSIKKALTAYYGSTKELNKRLDYLSWIHGDPNLDRKPGSERIDARLQRMIDDPSQPEVRKASASERTGRLEELWRIEQLKVLSDVGVTTAKEYNVDWKPATTYQTDGVHRSRDAYIQRQTQYDQYYQALQSEKDNLKRETKKLLDDSNLSYQRTKKKQEQANKNYKRDLQNLARANQQIDDVYEAVTGRKRPEDVGSLDALHAVKKYVASTKEERDEAEQQNAQLKQENEQLRQQQAQLNNSSALRTWQLLRQFVVDVIEALLPVIRELDHNGVKGQRWRDSMTEQVDRQMKKSSVADDLVGPKSTRKGPEINLER